MLQLYSADRCESYKQVTHEKNNRKKKKDSEIAEGKREKQMTETEKWRETNDD